MPVISISTVSPTFMNSGGLRAKPTPPGVPVAIRSPGWRVRMREMSAIRVGTSKQRSPRDERWRSSPLTRVTSVRVARSPTSSGVTSQGPTGVDASKFLPANHCGVRVWKSRTLTSSRTLSPATCCQARPGGISRPAALNLQAHRPSIWFVVHSPRSGQAGAAISLVSLPSEVVAGIGMMHRLLISGSLYPIILAVGGPGARGTCRDGLRSD